MLVQLFEPLAQRPLPEFPAFDALYIAPSVPFNFRARCAVCSL